MLAAISSTLCIIILKKVRMYAIRSLRILLTIYVDIFEYHFSPQVSDGVISIRECMPHTREETLALVDTWLDDLGAPNILWLTGFPGSGKSALAATITVRLRERRRLGSSFIFRRNEFTIKTPVELWRRASFYLSRQYPTIRLIMLRKLQEEQSLITASATRLFVDLIEGPLVVSRTSDIPHDRLHVLIIEALDQCGGDSGRRSDERRELLRTLQR